MTTDDSSLLLSVDSTPVQISESLDWTDKVTLNQSADAFIVIQRQAYDLPTFDRQYKKEETKPSTLLQVKSSISAKCVCTGECVRDKLFGLFPVVDIIKNYQWKGWLLSDIIAGLCVGVINIPQSMAFAMLASLPPVYGLYASLFPVFFYFLFGTSRHISVGAMAIISILIGDVVVREAAGFIPSHGGNVTAGEIEEIMSTNFLINGRRDDPQLSQYKVQVAMSLSFLIGLMQIVMSFLKLGMLATFMSLPLIGGFMAGAAVHIIMSQVPFCLGITVTRQTGLFNLVNQLYAIILVITQSNVAELIITLICMLVLIIIKEGINEKYKDRLKIPIPAEILVVSIAIPVSYFGNLTHRFQVRILDHIPIGIPKPEVPEVQGVSHLIVDAFIIAIVSFAISISLAKYFSEKYHYPIDQDQEMFAYGVMHTFSVFFHSYAGAQSPPRTMLQDSAGGKTQLASLASTLLILLVCFWLAPLFEYLPTSVLGSMIIVAVIPLLKRAQDLSHFWLVNKHDFFVWVVSFLAVIVVDIEVGLVMGIGLSILSLVIETLRISGYSLGLAQNTEVFMPQDDYKGLSDMSSSGMFIFKAPSPLYFANTEALKSQLFRETVDPKDVVVVGKNLNETDSVLRLPNEDPQHNNALNDRENEVRKDTSPLDQVLSIPSMPVIVLDCSSVTYIDLAGLDLIKQLRILYNDVGMRFVLANCNNIMLKKLVANGEDVNEFVYPSIVDAVVMTRGILEA